MYLDDRIRLCVLYKICIPGCDLAKGFDFTQKRFI